MKKSIFLIVPLLILLLVGCANPLMDAAAKGDFTQTEKLLSGGADVNAKSGYRYLTPLHYAAWNGQAKTATLLIQKGANVNAVDTFRWTPLHWAAANDRAEVVAVLLENGADREMMTDNDNSERQPKTALMLAREKGYTNTMRMLSSAEGGIASGRAMPIAVAPTPSAETVRGNDAYAEAKTANTSEAYEKFLKAYPSSEHRREALEAMAGLIQKRAGTNADYRKFVSAYEDGLEFVPEKYSLALTGPNGMRVYDIVALRKKGVEDNLICAKIRAGKGKYKDYSFEEMDALKKMGVSAVLIEAMIDSTTRAKREEEELQKKKAMEDILAEIQRVQNRLEELKTAQSSAVVPVSVSAQQGQGPSVTDTVTNCTAQISALEACKHLPGLGAMICKATAKSQFPCE